MFFSVIIPIYNAERTIIRCLESVKLQTFSDFEVILVNDGSTDTSELLCCEYIKKDDRFRYIAKSNTGVASTRNVGIAEARGEYITFLDSDDSYSVVFLKKMKDLIDQYPDCDNFWCGYRSVYPNNKEDLYLFTDSETISLSNRNQSMLLFQKQLVASLWTKAFKRSIILSHNLRLPDKLSLGEDLIFNFDYLDACQNETIVILNEPLYNYYCFDGDSLNHRYRSDLQEIYKQLVLTLYQYQKKWRTSEQEWKRFYSIAFNYFESVLYNTYHDQCTMTLKQKRQCRKSIISNSLFQSSVMNSDSYINPLIKRAYISKSEFMFDTLHRLFEWKSSISDVLKLS